MGFKDWVDRYIISVPSSRAGGESEIEPGKLPVQAAGKVGELAAEMDESSLRALPAAQTAEDIPFEKVFEAAKIPLPAHRFTVEKVGEMLRHPKLAPLDRGARAAAVLVALDSQGVTIQSVIEEAAQKDRALDVFEKVQRERLQEFARQKEEENRRLASEIEKNRQAVAQMQRRVEAWAAKKSVKEAELQDIVSHFTSEAPSQAPAKPPPSVPPGPAPKTKLTDLTQ